MYVNKANEGSDIEHIWQTTWRIGFYRGGPVFMSALSGIDIALWDLKGMSRSKINRTRVDVQQLGN
jgi:L-alanine-DL-glutamate epimerase-like enolase superfamily enzyme